MCKVGSRQIGGRTIDSSSSLWQTLFPGNISIKGRVRVGVASSYIVQMRLTPSRELAAVAFTPSNDAEKEEFDKILSMLKEKECVFLTH